MFSSQYLVAACSSLTRSPWQSYQDPVVPKFSSRLILDSLESFCSLLVSDHIKTSALLSVPRMAHHRLPSWRGAILSSLWPHRLEHHSSFQSCSMQSTRPLRFVEFASTGSFDILHTWIGFAQTYC